MSSSSKEQDITQTLSTAAKNVQAVAKPVFEAIVFMIPIVIRVTKITYETYIKLPQNAILFIYGSVFCFFGGAFPTVFAAIQAAEHGGRTTVVQALQDLADEATYIIEESKKDDDANETKDNNSQTLSKEYVERKTKLVLRKMNPEKVDKALSSIYAVWISVIAVLSIQFARTISMSLSIADFLKKPLDRYVTPFATKVCPTEYAKWIPVVMSWIGKTIGMMIAWYIQVRKRQSTNIGGRIETMMFINRVPGIDQFLISNFFFPTPDNCFSFFFCVTGWFNDGKCYLSFLFAS